MIKTKIENTDVFLEIIHKKRVLESPTVLLIV